MTPRVRPAVPLSALARAYHVHNASFADFVEGRRKARTASQIPPPATLVARETKG